MKDKSIENKPDLSLKHCLDNFDTALRKNAKCILIFLLALVFIITFSNPAVFLNDEWITVNQLNQLEKGHQVVFNEGKYGVFKNGTPGQYFLMRDNKLGYSLMLPVLSFPALTLFGCFGDHFRLFVILLWAVLAILALLLIGRYYPSYATFSGIKWTHAGMAVVLLLTLLNTLLYTGWPFADDTAPREVAAVVFTNHILFALSAVIVYMIFSEIIREEWAVLFSTAATFCCSSFLFWAANAKDHILVLVLFSLVILFFIRYFKNKKYHNLALAFIFTGLTAWARPEVGFTVFACSFVFIAVLLGLTIRAGEIFRTCAIIISTALFALIGSIPLLVNNYLVTGNPLKLSFYIYGESTATMQESLGISEGMAAQDVLSRIISTTGNAVVQTLGYYHISFDTYPGNLVQVLFLPGSGTMSFLALCPLLVIAVFLGLRYFLRKDCRLETVEKTGISFLVVMTIAVFLTYSNTLAMIALTSESGIIPDLRYLSPAYLSIGILAMFLLFRSGFLKNAKQMLVQFLATAVVLTPVAPFLILIVFPSAGNYYDITRIFLLLSTGLAVIVSVLLLTSRKTEMQNSVLEKVFPVVILVPFIWQMLMLFMFSPAKINGYTFWLPVSEVLFHLFFG